MLAEYAGRLPAKLEALAQGTYSRTRVERYCRWLDAVFGLRFAFFKDGGVLGTQSAVALRSDAPTEYRNPAHETFG
jgi:hypothetical protein